MSEYPGSFDSKEESSKKRHLSVLLRLLKVGASSKELHEDDVCEPIIADLKSENRFYSCGGKPYKFTTEWRKMATFPSVCLSGIEEYLKFVATTEREVNHCKVETDCVAGDLPGITYHVNSKEYVKSLKKLYRKYSALIDICKGARLYLGGFLALKDLRDIHSYKCEQSLCVPQFTGKKIYWSDVRSKLIDEYHKKYGIDAWDK